MGRLPGASSIQARAASLALRPSCHWLSCLGPATRKDGLERAVPLTQQVQIPRGSVGLIRPEAEEHRPFEHEALPDLGRTEAVKEALETEAGEQCLVIIAPLPCTVEQARGDGGREIVLLAGHAIASR